jgi:diguanylate cyclase (GGDEF)-like protein
VTEAQGEERNAFPAARPILALVLSVGTAVVVAHDWLGFGGSRLDLACEGWLYDAVIVAAGLTCLLRAWAADGEKAAWLAIGIGVLCWGAGEIYWTAAILNDPSPPYPSPADAGYIAYYAFAAIGLVLLVRDRADALDWRLWMDGAIAALGTAALGAAFVFDFIARQAEGSTIEVATTLAYPLGDILMVALVVGVIAVNRRHAGRAWSLLLGGLSLVALADILYSLRETSLGLPGGAWIDPLYLLAVTLLAAAAWRSRPLPDEREARLDNPRELMVPLIFGAVMIGLLALQYAGGQGGLAPALTALTMVAVIVRLGVSVRQNRALLEQVRTDPLTGLGSRGAMQVDFDRLCEAATPAAPLGVALFDLNGFKRYNDTLGHPAGDELLTRLGRRLAAAIGEEGAAYRIGGDEFCLLLGTRRSRFDRLLKDAAAALTESNRGVEVSASWGLVTVPEEAGSPSEALRLADLRMYAQKESRRVARGGYSVARAASSESSVAETSTSASSG